MDGNFPGVRSMTKIKDIPSLDRPREKAYLYGLSSLSNAELLALIISSGCKDKSALDIAYELLAKFNGINGVINAGINDLMCIKGISKAKAVKMAASFYLYKRSLEETAVSLKRYSEYDVANMIFNKIIDRFQEALYLVIMNQSNQILGIEKLASGSEDSLSISETLVIKHTLKYGGKRFYLLHNHPSNNLNPSKQDKMFTSLLDTLSLTLRIDFIEHMIVTEIGYYAIKQNKTYLWNL